MPSLLHVEDNLKQVIINKFVRKGHWRPVLKQTFSNHCLSFESFVEQELLSPSVAHEFIPGFSGVRVSQSFVDPDLSICPLLFFVIVLSVLRFTASGYPFDILDLRLLVTPLIS